jgi:hypothetical protein
LRYRWQDKGRYVYEIHFEVDGADAKQIGQGHATYAVTKGQAPAAPPVAAEIKGTGTAFVVHRSGYLVSCAHVVAGATRVEVTIGGDRYPATVALFDKANDLAVLKIMAKDLPELPLADSDAVELGQDVRAIGFPLSDVLGESLKATRGTVSGLQNKGGHQVLLIDASVNPGNSGGPLVNDQGEVLGVINAKLTGKEISNVASAVPINLAKQLLQEKGVAFKAKGAGAALNGPALVRQVSASVALVTVAIRPTEGDERYKINFHGSMTTRRVVKPAGGIVIPGFVPMLADLQVQGDFHTDEYGHINNVTGEWKLPFILTLAIDPLSADGQSTWNVKNQFTVEEHDKAPNRDFFGRGKIRGIRPPARLAPPNAGIPAPAAQQGIEHTAYRLADSQGQLVVIHKTYEMKTPHLQIEGTGQIQFDRQTGLNQSMDYAVTLSVLEKGAWVRVPIKATYKLLPPGSEPPAAAPPAAVAAAPIVPAPARPAPVAPPRDPPPAIPAVPNAPAAPVVRIRQRLTEERLNVLVADLQSTERVKKLSAASRLALAEPIEGRRAEVARRLEPLLADNDRLTRQQAARALAAWGTRDNVPALIKALNEKDSFARRAIIEALTPFNDEKATAAVADCWPDHFCRSLVTNYLKAVGTPAEKVVIGYVQHADWQVRIEACKTLEEIGTNASLESLRMASNDQQQLVALAAERALKTLAARQIK